MKLRKVTFLIVWMLYLEMVMCSQYSTLFVSPFRNAKDVTFTAHTIAVHSVQVRWECTLQCYKTPQCVAVNIGPADQLTGSRTCQLKSVLITYLKWTSVNPGYEYLNIGKFTH